MISEIDLLREDIPRLEERFGADNPFVEILKEQLATLRNPTMQRQYSQQIQSSFFDFITLLFFKK